ncbi:MAG TPA: type II toxin-antitoxin system prevent-host-death family antitoxin [Phycisphaerae bacterium]|nr:type II toxin-antitoxin system prevent-host-death family antitoxin [Phycisphaerae bacterium]
MITINTHQAKTQLSRLLAQVEEGREEVLICRNGKPVAKLVAVDSGVADPLRMNPRLGPVVFHEDPCAPLDDEAWPEECR